LPEVELSRKAASDLLSIFLFSTQRFGHTQAQRYQQGLRRTLDLLARKPLIGRAVGDVDDQLHRHPYESHVIFYRVRQDGIIVVRVLPMAGLKGLLKDDLDLS
jgi:toxin ParE1/3/4